MAAAKSARWQGQWIWDQTDGTEKNAYVLFRRSFELRTPPDHARLRITAMSRYRLWVNGVFLGEGPPKSQPFLTYYDEYDLLPGAHARLSRGDNVICVLVNHVGYDDDSRGGLLAEIVDDSGNLVVATDLHWKAHTSNAWRRDSFFVFFNRVVPYQEHFNAQRFDWGWLEPRYDDAAWNDAQIIQTRGRTQPPQVAPWTRIVPRDIPFMRESTARAASIAETGEVTAAMNRMRSEDLSISLSQPLVPLEHATITNPESLLEAEGATGLACSTLHRTDPRIGIREPGMLLDFGRIINAWVELEIEGPPGATLEIGYAERLLDGQFNNAIEGQFADSITLGSRRVTWRCFAWKAFRFLRLRVHGAFSPIVIHDLRAVRTEYPFADRIGFTTPDEELASVFAICRDTVELGCNEYITDTPWREQGQWLGDVSAVTLGAIYACFGDTALARKFLVQSAATQYPTGFLGNMTNTYNANWQWVIPDFSLWWLMAVRDHYRYTGDESVVHELYGVAVRLVEAVLAYTNEDGLVSDMPYWVFIDWADVETSGASAAYNAIFAGALDAMCELAGVRGDTWFATRCNDAVARLRNSFADTFWDGDEHLFDDAATPEGRSGRFSEQTNAAAMLFGLASDTQSGAIIDRLWARGDNFLSGTNNGVTEANPFFTSVVLRALSAAGRADLAIWIIRDRWGARMVAAGSTSTHEEWSIHGSWRNGDELMPIMRTLSHAWSAFPARWLTEHLAGIRIEEPRCTAVHVDPVVTDFDWETRFQTPLGEIRAWCTAGKTGYELPDSVLFA
jgi:hypothetical protein